MLQELYPVDFIDSQFIVQDTRDGSYLTVTTICDDSGKVSFELNRARSKEEAQRYIDYAIGKITYKEYHNISKRLSRKPIVCATCGTAIFFYEDKEAHQIALCPKCNPHTSVIDSDGTRLTPVVH